LSLIWWHTTCLREATMFDLVLVLVTVGFFGLMFAYGRACERL
jgi:hypothetical protein